MILTNARVVRDAKDVTVKLTDRREFKAKVLGMDPKTDVAVLKIDAKNLPTLSLGNSRDLKVGQWVLAIGSPFWFHQQCECGVVSAKGRALPGDGYVPFIQTDAAVNPGNSGGPLIDSRGEVVGITSQICTGNVVIRDAEGHTLLQTVSTSPFVLARLSPGRYGVDAMFGGKTLHETVVIMKGQPAKALFLWPTEVVGQHARYGRVDAKVVGRSVDSSEVVVCGRV